MKRALIGFVLLLAFSAAFMASVVGLSVATVEGDVALPVGEWFVRVRAVIENSTAEKDAEDILNDGETNGFVKFIKSLFGFFEDQFTNNGLNNYARVLTLTLIPLDWTYIQDEVIAGRARDFRWLFGDFSAINFDGFYERSAE